MKKRLITLIKTIIILYGKITKKHYWEDFVRVYPDGLRFNRFGKKIAVSKADTCNFLNHQKVYLFAAQFANGGIAADIGCGSGYGSEILKDQGAEQIFGTDVSKKAIGFARKHFGQIAEFSNQDMTHLDLYSDRMADLTICSEVLEHIKEYGKENLAIEEMKRITKPGGIIIIGTPNSELLGDHGFYFSEMDVLLKAHFKQYCIFENALIPFGEFRKQWKRRLSENQTGVTISQQIRFDEILLPDGIEPQLKKGIAAGSYQMGTLNIDTTLLHNTHSWMVVAIRDND